MSAAHPLARSAAVWALEQGGSAIDAAIAAQAVIAVTMPQAAGLGGDMLALVRDPRGQVHAINGTGRSPAVTPSQWHTDGGSSVTTPGLVAAWGDAHRRWGRLTLLRTLEPAIEIAEGGYLIDGSLVDAARRHRPRLQRYGGDRWNLLDLATGDNWLQPELAALLRAIGCSGADAFYHGDAAAAIAAAASKYNGTLSMHDLDAHRTSTPEPLSTAWDGGRLVVQPPPTQGALLAMAAAWLEVNASVPPERLQHVLIEATEAAFAHRDEVNAVGAALLDVALDIDPERAENRGGPRAYLHTAGVAVADSDGMVVSSLVSIFDDFGSAVFVPELGITLNNRAAGFTVKPNEAGPSKRPVHTLAPAMLIGADGFATALATPGADGQVQTLLQVLARTRFSGIGLKDAIDVHRWRSEAGDLLIEDGHPDTADLIRRGHRVRLRRHGDDLFGAVVAAGIDADGPFAVGDWRRDIVTGAL